MNAFRKVLAWMLAVALTALVTPAMAQNVKYFKLEFTTPDSSTATPQTTEIYLKYTNLDTGNSNFNSVAVTADPRAGASVKITGIQAVGLPGGALGTPRIESDTRAVLGDLPPIRRNQSVTVKVTVQISATVCTGAKIVWNGSAWTGSISSPSTNFVQSNTSPETTIGGCGWSVSGTKSITKGTSDVVELTITNNLSSPVTIPFSAVAITGYPFGLLSNGSITQGSGTWPLAAGASGTVKIPVSAPCSASGSGAWSGIAVNSTAPSSNTSSISITGACTYNYSLSGTATGVVRGSTTATEVTITVANDANSSASISDITLTAPSGVTIDSVVGKSGFPIAKGASGSVTLKIKASCSATGGAWSVASIAPSEFSTTPTSNTTNVGVTGNCDLKVLLPTSFVTGVGGDVKVQFVDGAGTKIGGTSGTIYTIVATGTCTLPANTQATMSGGEATFSGLVLSGDPGKCSIKIYDDKTIDGVGYEETLSFLLFAADLNCNDGYTDLSQLPYPPNGGVGYFAAGSVTDVNQVGFAAGYRAKNDKGTTCANEFINYSFKNNITGPSGVLDGFGNTLPSNAVSFLWDEIARPDGVFAYTVTFDESWVDATSGLPKNGEKFCKLDLDTDGNPVPTICTDTSKQFPLRTCIGTALKSSSIPGDDPACILRRNYITVSPLLCPTLSPANPDLACVRVTTTILDAKDPPVIWSAN